MYFQALYFVQQTDFYFETESKSLFNSTAKRLTILINNNISIVATFSIRIFWYCVTQYYRHLNYIKLPGRLIATMV